MTAGGRCEMRQHQFSRGLLTARFSRANLSGYKQVRVETVRSLILCTKLLLHDAGQILLPPFRVHFSRVFQ